jgi:hypothetical protein
VTTASPSRPSTDPFSETDFERAPEEECLATFWRQATPGAAYVRGTLPMRYVPGQSFGMEQFDLDWDTEEEKLVMRRQRGAAVWQFLGDDWRSRVAWALQDQGVRTLIEVDDNYTTPHPHMPGQKVAWHKTIADSAKPGGTGYSNEMHRLILPTMDGVIVSTEYLRDAYLEYSDNVYLCPNTVDPDDWTELDEKNPEVLRIVYSGSMSHLRDASQVKKALKWAARQKGVEVWLQGVRPMWGFTEHVPWTDSLAAYRKVLGRFDVGVAPLVPGQWANGKSDLKALEYTMAGVLPLLARTEPYRPWWDSPLVCEPNEASWVTHIKWVVQNRDAIPELLANARDYVLSERTAAGNAWRYREAINA